MHQSAAHGIRTHVEKADDRSEVGGMGCGARFRGHRRPHRYNMNTIKCDKMINVIKHRAAL